MSNTENMIAFFNENKPYKLTLMFIHNSRHFWRNSRTLNRRWRKVAQHQIKGTARHDEAQISNLLPGQDPRHR